jgi:hypothetical protein
VRLCCGRVFSVVQIDVSSAQKVGEAFGEADLNLTPYAGVNYIAAQL